MAARFFDKPNSIASIHLWYLRALSFCFWQPRRRIQGTLPEGQYYLRRKHTLNFLRLRDDSAADRAGLSEPAASRRLRQPGQGPFLHDFGRQRVQGRLCQDGLQPGLPGGGGFRPVRHLQSVDSIQLGRTGFLESSHLPPPPQNWKRSLRTLHGHLLQTAFRIQYELSSKIVRNFSLFRQVYCHFDWFFSHFLNLCLWRHNYRLWNSILGDFYLKLLFNKECIDCWCY